MKQNLFWTGAQRQFGPGIGFNWFDFLGMGGHYAHPPAYYPLHDPCYPTLDDAAGWKALLDELTRLRPGFLRFGIPADPHIDAQGKLCTDTVHLQRLERIAQWAAREDCTILLDTFLLPSRYEIPEPTDGSFKFEGMYQLAAIDNRALAREFIAPFLHHIVRERKLSAVKYFNPVNEPLCYGVYQTLNNQPDAYVHYVDMYREIREALDVAGIPREELGLIGADNVEAENFPALEMLARGVDLDPYVDAYTLHYYLLRLDYLPQKPEVCTTIPMLEGMDKHSGKIARYCHQRGKPLWAGEIGSFYYGWRQGDPAGPTTFEATLTVAEGVIRGINLGIDAFAFWCLLNPNTIDGHWAIMKISDGKVIPTLNPYAVYGTLSRLCRPRSTIFPLRTTKEPSDLAHLHGTAILTPEGRRFLLLVNDHPDQEISCELRLPDGWNLAGAKACLINAKTIRAGTYETPTDALQSGSLVIPPFSLMSVFL